MLAPSFLLGGPWQEISEREEREAGVISSLCVLSVGARNEARRAMAPVGGPPCALLSHPQDHILSRGGPVPPLTNPGLLQGL